jgi:hypothetical protein
MEFSIAKSIEVLSATPATLRALLGGLSNGWTGDKRESPGNDGNPWTPFDVVGHLIHGEETDWIPRAQIILEQGETRTFTPFDRFAQFENSKGKSLAQLLDEFDLRRRESLETLENWNLTEERLDLKGMHPELGEVTLRQLLSTWVVHDLNHIRQVVTGMAMQYEGDVGVWKEYLSILK